MWDVSVMNQNYLGPVREQVQTVNSKTVREEQKAPTLCDGIHDWNSVIPTGLNSREYREAGSGSSTQVANKEGLGALMQTC